MGGGPPGGPGMAVAGDTGDRPDLVAGSIREYRELSRPGARPPSFETWDRICKLFGWHQAFAVTGTRGVD